MTTSKLTVQGCIPRIMLTMVSIKVVQVLTKNQFVSLSFHFISSPKNLLNCSETNIHTTDRDSQLKCYCNYTRDRPRIQMGFLLFSCRNELALPARRAPNARAIRRGPCSYVCLEKEDEGAAEAMEETEAAAEEEEERLLRKIM